MTQPAPSAPPAPALPGNLEGHMLILQTSD